MACRRARRSTCSRPRRCGTRAAASQGATDLAAVKGADVVVMTAGFPRKPGMSRSDLLKANADIIRPAAEAVKQHAPNAYVVVVTNPLDVMAGTVLAGHRLPEAPRARHGRHSRLRALPRVPRHGAGRLRRRRAGHGARRPRRLHGAAAALHHGGRHRRHRADPGGAPRRDHRSARATAAPRS